MTQQQEKRTLANRLINGMKNIHSPEAEAAILGSITFEPSILPDVIKKLPSIEAFFLPENQIIYKSLMELQSQDKPIDAIAIRTHLTERDELEKAGNVDYIIKILEAVPSAANWAHYADIVRDKWKRRKVIAAGEKILKECESTGSAGESIHKIQQLAAGLEGAIEPNYSRPILKSLADVQAKPISFLWYNKIPMGMLTLLEGDGGLGKSFLSLYIAAKISTGGEWPDINELPDNKAPMGSVIILSAEDDLEHIIRPRLDTLKADVSKIISLEGVKVRNSEGKEGNEYFNLRDDMKALEQAISSCNDCKLVIIDPLSAYLGAKTDSHKDSDVRCVLSPLIELAERKQVAILGIMHLNKNSNNKAIYRGMGSVAFNAAARTAWMVSKDPDNPESKRRLFTPMKHNVLVEPTGLAFEIVDGKVVFEDEPLIMSADEALQSSTVESPLLDKAVNWLIEQLPTGRTVASTEISRLAAIEGITESTLRRAKRKIGVNSFPCEVQGKKTWFIKRGTQQSE
jgi:putative DNA primase/helicase